MKLSLLVLVALIASLAVPTVSLAQTATDSYDRESGQVQEQTTTPTVKAESSSPAEAAPDTPAPTTAGTSTPAPVSAPAATSLPRTGSDAVLILFAGIGLLSIGLGLRTMTARNVS